MYTAQQDLLMWFEACLNDILTFERDSAAVGDMAFIQHIQQHLEPGQEVVCKICGKTAREIIENGLS